MRVPAMFDFVAYNEKPSNNEVGRIKNRIQMQGVKDYTLEELYNKCIAGYSFIPGVLLGGLKKSNWKYQQVFAIDVDDGMGVEEALAIYKEVGLEPFAIYKSYSHTEEHQKFRVLFCMDECIDDLEVRDKVLETLAGLLGCADKKCLDAAHYFNGTSKGGAFFREIVIKKEDVLSHWKEEYSDLLSSKKTRKGSGRGRKKSDRDYTPYVDGKIVPFVLATYRLNAKADVNALKKMFETRRWKEGDHRERFVFVLYNVAKIAYGAEEALKMVQEMNNKMAEPLSERELYWAIEHTECHTEMTDIHGDSIYIFKRETIAGEEWLDMTNEEICQSGFLATKMKNDRANKNRPIKKSIKEKVIELCKEGKTTKEIEGILKEEGISLSLRTIQRYIKNDRIPQTIFYNIYTPTPVEESNPIEEGMNEEQERAYNEAVLGRNVAMIAKGGCGKSYTLNQIKQSLAMQGKVVASCAATGLAAQSVEGSTVHHLFGIIPNEEYKVSYNVAMTLLEYDAIIIDEVGMLSSEVFSSVCKAIKHMEEAYSHHIQIVVAGDVLQLESVSGTYYFESPEYSSMGFVEVCLTKNMRQTNRAYDNVLSRLREGDATVVPTLNRIYSHEEDASALYVYAHKFRATQKNLEVLGTLSGEATRLDEHLTVKVGAKVVVTANARPDRHGVVRYYNGMQGVVKEARRGSVVIETADGRKVTIKKQTIAIDESNTYEGYPLALGYALTIHKVQGMTLDELNIHPSCFASGQLYTALSRVKTPGGVHLLAPIKESDVVVSDRALSYVRMAV